MWENNNVLLCAFKILSYLSYVKINVLNNVILSPMPSWEDWWLESYHIPHSKNCIGITEWGMLWASLCHCHLETDWMECSTYSYFLFFNTYTCRNMSGNPQINLKSCSIVLLKILMSLYSFYNRILFEERQTLLALFSIFQIWCYFSAKKVPTKVCNYFFT